MFLIFVCYGVTIPLGHVNGYIYFDTLGSCKMGVMWLWVVVPCISYPSNSAKMLANGQIIINHLPPSFFPMKVEVS